jgi:hypothetical protein
MTRRTSKRRSSKRLSSNAALRWYSSDTNIWVTHPVDVLIEGRGRVFPIEVTFRADGRDGECYRVDCADYTARIWEAIDGGRAAAPRTLAKAKKLASSYLRAAQAQGTLSPKGF